MVSILPLTLRGIRRSFGRQVVLSSVDLQVESGEVVAIVGANGSGKTTLFSIIAGLQPAERGERYYGELGAQVTSAVRARFAYLAHEPQLYPILTAVENLELYAKISATAGRPLEKPEKRLAEIGLREAMHRPVGTFSRGMKQRVAIARTLNQEADFLLLDEPFTALDRKGRQEFAGYIKAEAKRGAGILLCSHDMESVALASDRTLLLERGRLRALAECSGGNREHYHQAILEKQARPTDKELSA